MRACIDVDRHNTTNSSFKGTISFTQAPPLTPLLTPPQPEPWNTLYTSSAQMFRDAMRVKLIQGTSPLQCGERRRSSQRCNVLPTWSTNSTASRLIANGGGRMCGFPSTSLHDHPQSTRYMDCPSGQVLYFTTPPKLTATFDLSLFITSDASVAPYQHAFKHCCNCSHDTSSLGLGTGGWSW